MAARRVALHLACLSCTLGLADAFTVRAASKIPTFDAFLELHGRTYKAGSEEYGMRRALYEKRAAAATTQNSLQGRNWNAGANQFWDRTDDELSGLWGWRGAARPGHNAGGTMVRMAHVTDFLQQEPTMPDALPAEKNWKNLHAMQHIRNQGNCGSCWAIATSTVLQAHTEIHTGQVRTFSPQQLVSCVPNPGHCGGNGGCEGATVELALDWVMHHGAAEEFEVPYAGQTGTCPEVKKPPQSLLAWSTYAGVASSAFGMKGWEKLPENQYEPLMRAVVERGPVGISVAAKSWVNYDSGIFDGCSKDAVIDHAVVLIGYGEEAGTKYWLVQNSWGREWGESGTIRLLRRDNDQEQCGVDRQPELGTACQGGPSEVTVCGMCGILYDSAIPHYG